VRCARKRVARLMRPSLSVRMWRPQEKSSHHSALKDRAYPSCPGPGKTQLHARSSRDRLWVAEITYVRTWEGWLHLSFVLDTYSRKVVGWSMANHLRAELVWPMPTTTRWLREFRLDIEARVDPPPLMAEPTDRQDGFSAEYIEAFYNTRRRHSALGHLSPSEYEEVRLRGGAVA
jgi:transposase InsO family protein